VSVSADGERAYIVNGSCITVLCTATRRFIDRIETGVDPVTAVESLDGSLLFVADNEGRVASLTVNVTTNKALAQILDADVIDLPMHELEATAV
jgi:DNA-binding beta-propeller fold protein YncE